MISALIIAPHPDDEVYGCTSFLAEGTTVFYCSNSHPDVSPDTLSKEANEVAERTGVEAIWGNWPTNFLDSMPQGDLIASFEVLLARGRPGVVLLPAHSYNQDHRAVTSAMLTALRPHDETPFVKRVLLYEQHDVFGTLHGCPFRPTYFRSLDLSLKEELYNIYESQIRGHRTWDHTEAIARVRGLQANMVFAEAFEVLRWVE